MSSTKSAGSSTVSRTCPVGQPSLPPGMAGSPDMLAGWFHQNGIHLDSDELTELVLLDTFLGRHVMHARRGDVQCMLLWNEWVRMFRRCTSQFPALIHEKEFRTAITGWYGVDVSTDGARGLIYSGIRFVP